MKKCLCIMVAAWLYGCTGTDFIDDPPMLVEPRILVRPDMAALAIGTSQSFEATFFNDMGTSVSDAFIRWSISDEAIATVDQDGIVRGLTQGQVTIVASVDGVLSDTVLVNVVDNSDQVAVVRITPDSAELQAGESLQLVAQSSTVGGDLLTDQSYTWRSSNEAVLSIDNAGQVTALAPGQATITAAVDGITSNIVRITVPGAERTGTFVARPNSNYSCEGTATVRPKDGGGLELVFGADFQVSAGPRLAVFLSNSEGVGPSSINLAPLQSTTGAQTYALPSDVELDSFNWVAIHCVPFNVTFGFAQLR